MTGDTMARKVLVADDSVTIQKVVGLTFASEDIELAYVDNGEEAIELVRQFRPDLIMADVLMPGKSGYEVCQAIKGDPELQHIPVLLLTGTFEPFDAERCRQVGADGTITKPFESQTLIRQVMELLDRPAAPREAAQPPAEGPEPTVEEAAAGAETPAAEPVAPPPPREEAPGPDILEAGPALSEPDPLDLEDENFGDELIETANAPQDLGAPPAPATPPAAEFEQEFQFNRDPEEVLERPDPALGDGAAPATPAADEFEQEFQFSRDPEEVLAQSDPALQDSVAAETPEAGERSPEPPSSIPSDPVTAPQETGETGTGASAPGAEGASPENDVWDLSDFEAVDEAQIGEPARTPEPEGADALWDEAAAEAIDIVESTSLHPEDDGFLLEEEAQQDTAAARALAEGPVAPDVDVGAPASGMETPPVGETPDVATEGDLGADLDLVELEEIPLETAEVETPPEEGDPFEQPPVSPEVPPPPPGEEDSFGVEAADEGTPLDLEACELSEVTLEDLPGLETEPPGPVSPAEEAPPVEAPPVETPPFEAPGAAERAPQKAEPPLDVASLLSDQTTEVVRHAVRDAVEKVTWEAYGDLSETVVRAVQEKVEKIAWEVIPQMAETIIKEEIRRLKEEKK
jgi:CheY-like chemotaxis protein